MNNFVPLGTNYNVRLSWVMPFLIYVSFFGILTLTVSTSAKSHIEQVKVRPFSHITKRFLKPEEVGSLIEESKSLVSTNLNIKAKHLAGALSKTFLANKLKYEGESYNDDEGEADMSPDCQKMLKDLSKECKWFGGG